MADDGALHNALGDDAPSPWGWEGTRLLYGWFGYDAADDLFFVPTALSLDLRKDHALDLSQYKPGSMVKPGENNPGFDYFWIHCDEKGALLLSVHASRSSVSDRRRAVCFEARCRSDSNTKLSVDEVEGKMELTYKALTKNPTSPVHSAILVIMAMRDVDESALGLRHSKDGRLTCIVLGREQLKTVFGPTLFSRTQFGVARALVESSEAGEKLE